MTYVVHVGRYIDHAQRAARAAAERLPPGKAALSHTVQRFETRAAAADFETVQQAAAAQHNVHLVTTIIVEQPKPPRTAQGLLFDDLPIQLRPGR